MNVLRFGNYMTAVKASLRDAAANEDLAGLLFNSVIIPTDLMNKDNEPFSISKETASKLINCQINIPRAIRSACVKPEVSTSIYGYFEKTVLPRLMNGLEDDLLLQLTAMIQSDKKIADDIKTELLEKAQKNTLAMFLADVFLYTLKKENKTPKYTITVAKSDTEFATEIMPVLDTKDRFKKFELLIPPEDVSTYEIPYVTELMAAYGDAEGITDFSKETLPSYPKYSENFSRQRKDFYAAESVRHNLQDVYDANDPDQFDVLKDETYDGVVDIWEQDHKNGFIRLIQVLAQAVQIRVDRCWLSRDTDWIGNSQKKGVCHVLVNEGRIKGWVKRDG